MRLGVYIAATSSFKEHPKIAEAASALLRDVFGEHTVSSRHSSSVSRAFRSVRPSSWKSSSKFDTSNQHAATRDALASSGCHVHVVLRHAAQSMQQPMAQQTTYRAIQVDGLSHLLSRSRAERRADDSAASRTSVVVAHVRTAAHAAGRPVSPGRARLSRLRPQRLRRRRQQFAVHLRQHRQGDGSLHRSA